MKTKTTMKERFSNEKGFTLVELLIVVIILAVLAAIVVPQFSSSTAEAKEAALDTTLTEMRNAIEIYYHQHGSVYPGANVATGGTPVGAANTALAFTQQLTMYSDPAGGVSNTKVGAFKYGPYLKKAAMPVNPIDNDAALLMTLTGNLAAVGTNAGGWWFDTVSGKFMANIDAYSTR